MTTEQIITPEVKARIEEAVRLAEQGTSGEIRVHVENHCKEDVLDRAAFIFAQLEMHKTALRNSVLIYAAFADKKMAIIGDAGIHEKLGENTWDQIKTRMLEFFREGKFEDGIVTGVRAVGEKICEFFPINPDDKNELPNTLSMGGHHRKPRK